MKKLLCALMCVMAIFIAKDVYAIDDDYVTASRGGAQLVNNYDEGKCVSSGGRIAFEVGTKCMFVNNMAVGDSEPADYHYYTDPDTSQKFVLGLKSTGGNNSEEYIHFYNYILTLNNPNSYTRNLILNDLEVIYGEEATFNAGIFEGKLYVSMGKASDPVVHEFDFDSTTKIINLTFDESYGDVNKRTAAQVFASYSYFFLAEADPDYTSAAKAIMEDSNKRLLLFTTDLVDDDNDVYDYSLDGDLNITGLTYVMTLLNGRAEMAVNAYNTNAAAQPPATPDPTQPTQPTQPVTPPNTGAFLSIVGIGALALTGVVIVLNKKSKFRRI